MSLLYLREYNILGNFKLCMYKLNFLSVKNLKYYNKKQCQLLFVGIVCTIKQIKEINPKEEQVMEMNEILNGLNSSYCNDEVIPQCPPTQGMSCGNNCGFGSWIWILLILFYSQGFGGAGNTGCCGRKAMKDECCCNQGNRGYGGFSSYLFLLVILFLCNGCSGNGNFGNNNLFGGCC